jgi:cobalt-zinc-cadmium efflux system outer membrane protein
VPLLLLLPALVLTTGPAGAHPLTLQEALELADAHNPELVQAERALPIAEAGVQAAGALPNPTVGMSYGPDDPKLLGTVEQRLPILGQRGAAVNSARMEIPITKAEIASRRLEVHVRVRRAYAALAAAEARRELAQQRGSLAASLSQMARKKFEAGTASEFEAEQADLLRRRSEQEAQDAEAAAHEAQVALAQLIGDSQPLTLEAATALWPVPEPEKPEVLEAALKQHPEVQAQEATQAAALARAHQLQVELLPVPVVSVELQRQPDPTTRVGVRAGLALDLPLLHWNGGEISQERARASQAEAAADAKLSALRAGLQTAQVRYQAALRKAHFFHQELLPAAERVVKLAQVAYQLGRTPLSNVLQAQADLAQSNLDALDADVAAWDALAALEESSGVRF